MGVFSYRTVILCLVEVDQCRIGPCAPNPTFVEVDFPSEHFHHEAACDGHGEDRPDQSDESAPGEQLVQ